MSFPRRFSISIDGRPVGMPKDDPAARPQAHAADMHDRPAIFEIQGDHLTCGSLVMGRQNMEDRSLMPKRVVWCPMDQMDQIQPVRIQDRGNGPELDLNGGRLAFVNNGQLVSPLVPDMTENQRVELRPEFMPNRTRDPVRSPIDKLRLLQPHPTIESQSSATPQSTASSRATGPTAPQWSERDVPPWLQKHMNFWKVEPTPIRARTHLEGIKKELEQEWEKQNKAAPKKPDVRAKRKADTDANAPARKKTKRLTPIKSEGTPQTEMPPPPPPKPLGNLKGKYAILTDIACCKGQ
ncbi:unnamed protein product [Fusarium graminearum]|uniref:Uncharacterized protein n=1 Tax=Gibberella zeae TaxID=5518 RepID=A0A4U9FAQ2_GIBZA|nr:unnamed protein product [Fusarium graminearum]CAF3504486.1 unnamed protein product [Fusarium graminearum]CAG2009422.1 unnamed protein product [Fusarium graminearum]VTO92522.1 unnamed protein product [Fusarium graminearum]